MLKNQHSLRLPLERLVWEKRKRTRKSPRIWNDRRPTFWWRRSISMRGLNRLFPLILTALVLLLSARAGGADLPATPNLQQSQPTLPQGYSTPSPLLPTEAISASRLLVRGPQTDATTKGPENGPESAFSPLAWSNWALVIVAAIAAWVAIRTLKELARQSRTGIINARATMRAADAARSANETLAKLERAWLAVEVEPTVYMLDARTEDYLVSFKFKVRNYGRCIAWLTGGNAQAWLIGELMPAEPSRYTGVDSLVPLAPNRIL